MTATGVMPASGAIALYCTNVEYLRPQRCIRNTPASADSLGLGDENSA